MKIVSNKFFILIFYFFGVTRAFSVSPPSPGAKPPTPPGTPIDENIIFVFILGILYGSYILFKSNSKQK